MLFAALLSSLPFLAAAASLDDYYLNRFGAIYGNQLQPASVVSVQAAGPQERCLTPLYHGLKRDWKQLAPETQKVLAKYLAKPVLTGEAVVRSSAGNFNIHYATSGTDVPKPTDVNGNPIPVTTWVAMVADVFENVYNVEVAQMGYTAAPTTAGAPYDIYLQDLGQTKTFGLTESDDIPVSPGSASFTSSITIDNDFADPVYAPYKSDSGLQITAAHEYHHAIQYGYNFFFDVWYAEATSTWIEDEVYDGVNQLYNYLSNYMFNTGASLDIPTDVSTGGGYGRWIFNRYLVERFNSQVIVRNIWDRLRSLGNANNGNDIPMLPVIDDVMTGTLGNDFFSFCKKLYVRDWSNHANETGLIHPILPITTYSSYPVNNASSRVPGVTLSHYSFAYYSFKPSVSAPQDLVLTISNRSPGITLAAFRKDPAGNVSEIAFAAATSTFTAPSFNAGTTSEVVLLVCNNNPTDTQSVGFSTDGTAIPIPQGGFPLLSPQQPTTPPVSSPASSGGGGGCFIATAAYGSYLHPKVMLLREFRDNYLLTNAPGRAFVALYYKVSPSFADFIARHDSLRRASRIVLTPVVLAVEYKGVATVVLLIGVFAMAGGYLRSRSFM
jgi:hypothetical protein